MNPQQIAVLVVSATLGALLLLLLVYGRPRRSRQEPTPANFSRGDPDSVLEGPRLHRMLVWALASSVFIAGFLVIYLVVEPFREASYANAFLDRSVERGKFQFTDAGGANCASCHGPDGGGGFAATNPDWPAPPLRNVFHRFSRDEIQAIVERGRPGTPMPSWHIRFGGPLNDQQIDDIVNFVENIQVEKEDRFELPADITQGARVFAEKCAVCHGSEALGRAMGKPLPTFYAPDLTTEFYRLGLGAKRTEIQARLTLEKDGSQPSPEEVEARLAAVPLPEILTLGEQAAKETIENGRLNTPMPSWKNRIRPDQIDAVVAYLRSRQMAGARR